MIQFMILNLLYILHQLLKDWSVKLCLCMCELTAVKVGCVGLNIHDASDPLSDHNVSSSVPLPHLEHCSGACIRHIKVVYTTKIDGKLF